MIFIVAKFQVLPDYADQWPAISEDFTQATQAEEGCLWFEWSRSLEDTNAYVLIEAFRDDSAAQVHVESEHFRTAMQTLPRFLAQTPKIVNVKVEQDDWSELQELSVD